MSQVPDYIEKGSSGEVVLFLHGVGGGARSWVPQIERFSTKYRAVAWNMPGYGESIPLENMSFPFLADSLLALLDDRDWEKVHLVGHSMGGMVAQEFAVAQQNRLHSLTLSATSPAFGRRDADFQKSFVEKRLAPLTAGITMSDLATELIGKMMSADADASGRRLAHDCMANVPVEVYRAAIECIITFEQRTNLPNIRVPTLAIAGETDTTAAATMMEKMAAKIPGCRYVCLPKVGHLAYLEDPLAFNSVLSDFLLTVSN